MDIKAAKLALIGLSYGAERIPDKVFESLPGHYFKPKKVSEKDKKGRQHRRSHSFNHQTLSEPNVTTTERASSPSDYLHKPHLDKMSRDHHSHSNGQGLYQKYYTTGEPTRRYDEQYATEYQRGNQLVKNRPDRYDDRSSYDSRYDSRASSEPRHGNHRQRQRHRSRSSSASSKGSGHKSHKRSLSRLKEKTRQSRSQVRESVDDHVDLNAAGIGASAVGALAGGLLGHEVGHGKMSTIGGAILGGIGANLIEKHEKDKHERMYNSNDRRRSSSSKHHRRSSFGS